MTITSRYTAVEALVESVEKKVAEVPTGPTHSVPGAEEEPRAIARFANGAPKKVTRRSTVVYLDTDIVWNGMDVKIPVRQNPSRGVRGCGEVLHSNFKNCVPFCAGNRGAKVFRSGSVQGWGFKDVESFHSFVDAVLASMGGGEILAADTRVALAVLDSWMTLAPSKQVNMRELATACATRARNREYVNYNPNEFSGIKIKLEHPSIPDKWVSVVVRARGSVKMYLGNPGDDVLGTASALFDRVREILPRGGIPHT